ncbi:MAG: hypothetical protein NC299_10620 [Lachnospiraceae bacterium]|nr:hypothetical protein [Ruminococcus sp.]MCM1275801.1 hypothetical protein [Lachnospiraceae bacterium]
MFGMYKKICGGVLAIGGLLCAIGGIGAMANSATRKLQATINMAILARVGAIIAFVAAIALIAVVFRDQRLGKRAPIVGGVFALAGFIGQFLIDPMTSIEGMMSTRSAGGAVVGVFMLVAAGIGALVCGIVSVASKQRNA